MISLLIWVVLLVIVFAFLYWVVANYVPEPMRKWAVLVLVLLGVIFLIYIVTSMVGGVPWSMPPPHHR